MTISFINTLEAKEQFADLINRVSHNQERIILTRRGKDIAALISIDDFKLLLNIQDKQDLHEAIDALKEARHAGTLTLEEMATQLKEE